MRNKFVRYVDRVPCSTRGYVRQTCVSDMCVRNAQRYSECKPLFHDKKTDKIKALESCEACDIENKLGLPAAFLRRLTMLYTTIIVSNSAFGGMKKHS